MEISNNKTLREVVRLTLRTDVECAAICKLARIVEQHDEKPRT